MNLKSFKKKLLKDPEFKKEYYNNDDWIFEISTMVRGERIKQGLTQEKLAKLIGTKQSSIARLENGNNISPSINFLKKIADALNVELTIPKFISRSISQTNNYEIDLSKHTETKELKLDSSFVLVFNNQFTANNK
ncbi:MAG: helix-turn-helix transcriptional regulator [Patescibacteria group bacterium]